MTSDDLSKIAEAATPGPWEVRKNNRPGPGPDFVEAPNDPYLLAPVCEIPSPAPNAEFIATFNPQKVLEMIDENKRLQQRVTRLSNLERRNAKQRDEARARLAAVEKLHPPVETPGCDDPRCCDLTPTCTECIGLWPCPTIQAARGE